MPMPKPPPEAETHTDTASLSGTPKKPWSRPKITTVDGEVRSGPDSQVPEIETTYNTWPPTS